MVWKRPLEKVKEQVMEGVNEVFLLFMIVVLMLFGGEEAWETSVVWLFLMLVIINFVTVTLVSLGKQFR